MSSFALQAVLAVAIMAAAVVGAVVLLRRGSTQPGRSKRAASGWQRARAHDDVPPSIESVEAKAEEVAKLGESVLAAVGPIDLALRDLSKRVAELHARVDVSGKMLMRLAPRPDELSPEEKARAVVDARLGEVEPRLKGLTDDLSTLKQSVERITIHEGAIADTVETGLADFQGQLNALILRIERGERSRADLSLVASLASLKETSEQIAQRIADMERHFPVVADREARPDAISIPGNVPPPPDVAQGAAESAAPASADEAIGERADGGDVEAASDRSATGEGEPAPWVLAQKDRSKLRRRCLVCGQTKLLRPNERMCDDCGQLPEAERSRRRNFRKPKAKTSAPSSGPRPRGKRR